MMPRIATAMLIAVAVLALNGGMLRDAFAQEAVARLPAPRLEVVQPVVVRSAKVLSLLLILEALRQTPVNLDQPKG